MLERVVAAYLKKRIIEHGGTYRRVKWQGRDGAPDMLAIFPDPYRPDSAWFETKSSTGKLSAAQTNEIALLKASGQRVFVVSSFEEVDECLRKL